MGLYASGHPLIFWHYSFLDNALRVADIKYVPTTDDILRARLRTLGVEEHRLTMETGARFLSYVLLLSSHFVRLRIASDKGTEWVFYDVGGARGQRISWASYFEDGVSHKKRSLPA